ncbi:hypothetical protein ABK040_003289 [Willaertia magna]
MSEQPKFIDETGTVKRKLRETILMKTALKENQRKGRVRKVLKDKRLLQNYFEFSSKNNATCNNPTIQYEVKNLSDGHDFVSCMFVSNQINNNNNNTGCMNEENEEDKISSLNYKSMDNEMVLLKESTCGALTDNFATLSNNTLDNFGTVRSFANCSTTNNITAPNVTSTPCSISHNHQGLILVSEHFHLKLDIEDFIKSYNAQVLENKSF